MATRKTAAAAAAPRDPRVMSDAEVEQLLTDADGDLDTVVLSYDDGLRFLRRQKLVCRGPIAPSAREQIGKLLRAGQHPMAVAQESRTRGVRNRSTNELEPCGFDFVTMIEETKHPLDGSLMQYKCPQCGVEGEMRVMRLTISDAPARAVHEKLHRQFLRDASEAATKRAQRDAQVSRETARARAAE